MSLLEKLTKRAQKIFPRILLPESTDRRVIQAALSLSTQKIAKIVLLGNEDEVFSQLDQPEKSKKHNLEFIDPKDEKLRRDYAKTLLEIRKHKGLELNESLPTAEELAEIAQSAFKSAKALDIKPKIAMLSFSTNRNTKYPQVEKVRLATNICETKLPDVDIVGNIQLDAALEKKVLQIKNPEEFFEPPANVLIFPNLDAANIGYKLVQRFSGAKAIGPILQGIAKPVNDLSRGCSVDEIFNTVVITANQCK